MTEGMGGSARGCSRRVVCKPTENTYRPPAR
jgi:hypothetical protein